MRLAARERGLQALVDGLGQALALDGGREDVGPEDLVGRDREVRGAEGSRRSGSTARRARSGFWAWSGGSLLSE